MESEKSLSQDDPEVEATNLQKREGGCQRLASETWHQVKVLAMATAPVLLSIAIGTFVIFIWANVEAIMFGHSDMERFFNSSSISSLCLSEDHFTGVDLFGMSVSMQVATSFGMFVLLFPFKKKAISRLIISVVVNVAFAGIVLRKTKKPIPPQISAVYLFLGFWLPDVVRAMITFRRSKFCKAIVSTMQTSLITSCAGYLIVGLIFSTLQRNETTWIEIVLLGAGYPLTTILLRHMIRRTLSRLAVGRNEGPTKISSVRLQHTLNAGLVSFFLLPGFFGIFLIDERVSFITALTMQMGVEILNAGAFIRVFKSVPDAPMINSSWVKHAVVYASDAPRPSSTMSKFQRDISILLNKKLWEGLVSSEEFGEKCALILASLQAFAVTKDSQEFVWRLCVALLTECTTDMIKIEIFMRSGVIKKRVNFTQGPWEVLSGGVMVSVALFTNCAGVFLYCWKR